jgi:hypothetical protein
LNGLSGLADRMEILQGSALIAPQVNLDTHIDDIEFPSALAVFGVNAGDIEWVNRQCTMQPLGTSSSRSN